MTIRKLDNVSVLVQSCDSGPTTFITRTASPTSLLVTLNMLKIHKIAAIN